MQNETHKQKAFHLGWEPSGASSTEIVDGFHSMRGWQKDAFEALQKSPFMILNAPMGSGKSWMMCLLSTDKMISCPELRTIIAVPQTIIAPGFANAKLRMPDGKCIKWQIRHNLCRKDSAKGTIKYIVNWLKGSGQTLNEKTLICTHATLVKTYKKLKETGSLDLLHNLLFWIDEAHHVKNITMEDIEGQVISNGIGELVKYCLDTPAAKIELGLTTASFFRGDRCSLLTPQMEEQFIRFNLPYDDYLKSMKYLKSFSFDFLLCGYEYTNAIGMLAKERSGKDIIYIPHPKSRHSTGDKYQEVKNIFHEYQKIHTGELIDTVDGLNIFQNPIKAFKMLDLVDEDRRAEKKEFLNSDDLKEQRDALDLIITLGMFKEGANWIWADRSIIVGVRASLVDIVQMMGRLFRDAKDKEHVEVIQLLPFSLDQQNEMFLDNLNNYLKAIYASLILEDVFNPVKLNFPSTGDKDRKNNFFNKGSQTIPMSELIPDESTRLSVIDNVISRLATIRNSEDEKGKDITSLYEEYQNTLPEILENYGITENVEEIGKKIWGMLTRRTLKMQGISIEEVDFDIIKLTHPLEGLLRYTSSACGIDTLAQLREAIQSHEDKNNTRWMFNYNLLEKYSGEHGNCRVHKDFEITVQEGLIKLGSWYSDQKKNFSFLPKHKQELLQILPGFVAKKFRRNPTLSIDEWIDLFIETSQNLQTPLIPNTHVEEDFNLGAWLQHIRKKEEWEKLSPEQKQKLLDHNFKLSPKKERAEAAVVAMNQFALREGTTLPKHGHNEKVSHKGVNYEIRLDNLRNNIKKQSGNVEQSIIDGVTLIPNFLEELKDTEDDDVTYLTKGLAAYEKFNDRTKLKIVLEGQTEDGFDLYKWQKSVLSRRMLDEFFKENLKKIDFHFFSKHTVRLFFQDLHPKIEAFIQQNSHALIPQGYVMEDAYPLGEKVADLRERRTKLAQPILDYLDSLGNKWAWNYFEYLHLQNMEKLAIYIHENGYHKEKLPKAVRELISKVKKTLSKYPSSESIKKQIERAAPTIFEAPKDERFLALLAYAAREGHACPPIKHVEQGKKIGLYVSNMRQKYKNNMMVSEEIQKFESLHGWLWVASPLQSSTIREKVQQLK